MLCPRSDVILHNYEEDSYYSCGFGFHGCGRSCDACGCYLLSSFLQKIASLLFRYVHVQVVHDGQHVFPDFTFFTG